MKGMTEEEKQTARNKVNAAAVADALILTCTYALTS